MSVQYDKSNDVLVYKRKLEKGSGEGMYGLEVCKSLNMPDDFIDLAYTIRISNKNIMESHHLELTLANTSQVEEEVGPERHSLSMTPIELASW